MVRRPRIVQHHEQSAAPLLRQVQRHPVDPFRQNLIADGIFPNPVFFHRIGQPPISVDEIEDLGTGGEYFDFSVGSQHQACVTST